MVQGEYQMLYFIVCYKYFIVYFIIMSSGRFCVSYALCGGWLMWSIWFWFHSQGMVFGWFWSQKKGGPCVLRRPCVFSWCNEKHVYTLLHDHFFLPCKTSWDRLDLHPQPLVCEASILPLYYGEVIIYWWVVSINTWMFHLKMENCVNTIVSISINKYDLYKIG